jgi:predicted RNA-binding protein with PIN domain
LKANSSTKGDILLVIVDGYNVLRSSSRTAWFTGENLRAERERFVARLKKYQSGRQDKIIVVFDGAQVDTNELATGSLSGVKVIFSHRGQTADEVIKSIVEQNTNPKDIIVVSSDRDVVGFARSLGASVTGARSLADKLELLGDAVPRQEDIGSPNRCEYPAKGSLKEGIPYKRRKGNPRRPKRNRQRIQLW